MKVLFAPHSDDETLFAAYTLLRHQPDVVICFGSERDYGDTSVRTKETEAACRLLGVRSVTQWLSTGPGHLSDLMREYDAKFHPTVVWAPHQQSSHPHHSAVSVAAEDVFGDRVRYFHTYENGQKVRAGQKVEAEDGWPEVKRRALACHRTQNTHPRAKIFFDESKFELDEYEEVPDPPAEASRVVKNVQTPEDGLSIQTPESGAPPLTSRRGGRRKPGAARA